MADLNQVRRRADEFARLVDGAAPPPNPVQDPEFHNLITLVEGLREAGDVRPAPDFSATLRQRLVEEHAARITATPNEPDEAPEDFEDAESFEDEGAEVAEVAEVTPLTAAPRHRRGRLIAGAAAFAVVAGGIGSAAAAQQSMPGDALYGLKRGLESVASKVSVTDDSRGRRDLSHALARLTEAERLVSDKAKASTVSDTLGDFSTDARSGGDHLIASFKSDNDAATIEKIYVFADEAQRRLVALAKPSPPPVRPAIGTALRTVGDLVRLAIATCPACVAPKTGPISPDSVTTKQNPTEPNNPTAKEPEQSSTDLATPEFSTPPTVVGPNRPTVPTTGTSQTPGLPGIPSLPITIKPTLPLPSVPITIKPSLPTISLPLFNLPTLSLPLPTITLPPLLPHGLRLPTHPATTTSTGTAKSKSSATPSKSTSSTSSSTSSSTAPSKTAPKTSPIVPSRPSTARPTIPSLPWPWFTTMPSSPQQPTPTASAPSTPSPSETPSNTPTGTPTVTPTTTPTP